MRLSFRISIDWKDLLSDGENRRHCQEPIRGRMYRLEFDDGEKKELLDCRLCGACYIKMIDDARDNEND